MLPGVTVSDVGEKANVQDKHADVVERLTKLLEKYVADGRSTPGAPQQNDKPVDIWKNGAKAKGAGGKKGKSAGAGAGKVPVAD